MLTAQAEIPTERASRYLVQLCRHTTHMHDGNMHDGNQHDDRPGPTRDRQIQHVDYSDTCGTIRFTEGLCTLLANADTLLLRVDAPDETTLRRLQDGITRRLEKIGRRDHLTVGWQQPDPTPGKTPGETPDEPAAAPQPQGPRGMVRRLLWLGAAVLAIGGHLLFGGVLAVAAWAKWGFDALLLIIALKIVAVGIHVILGRYVLRNRPGLLTRWTRHRRYADR